MYEADRTRGPVCREAAMSVEPHAVVFRVSCVRCGEDAYHIVTIPKLATGEYFPVVGKCDACGVENELWGMPPLDVDELGPARPLGRGHRQV
jgi:hypothetical protein